MEKEFERDNAILKKPRKFTIETNNGNLFLKNHNTHIIETWHIGNMAYAFFRSKEVFKKYEKRFILQLRNFNACAIVLKINKKTFFERATENKGELEAAWKFYSKVYSKILQLLKKNKIKTHFIDANKNKKGVKNDAEAKLFY